MPFAVENLKVYQKDVNFADQVLTTTEQFPRGYGFLADQLNRASVSIVANLAEGNGRFTKPDRKNFFGIARGSIQECVPLLELAMRRGLITNEEHEVQRDLLEEIGKMISGLIKGARHPSNVNRNEFSAIQASANRSMIVFNSSKFGQSPRFAKGEQTRRDKSR